MLKDIRRNPLNLTDAYNLSHERLKENTDWEVSHMYNRASGMILFGFDEIVKSVLEVQITTDMVVEAGKNAKKMGLIFPVELFMKVISECNGYAPLQVQSLPSGTWCPKGTPFAQIRNTVKGYGELVSWFEGIFMMAYFPSSCATEAFYMRKYLERKKKQFNYDDSFLLKFHSFGFRGHRSLEDAYWAGTAWNLFMKGTDDFHTMMHTPDADMSSIPALAHKVTQQFDDEYVCFSHAISAVSKSGENIVALVIDTYDADKVINEYLTDLAVFAQSNGVHIVLRPDSGDTWDQAVRIYKNARKFKRTNMSVIIGEGMSFESAKRCDEYLLQNGVPLSFVSYGIGAGFYKHIERDTLGWAMKTAYSNGKPRMKFSMVPIKRSIPGIVGLKSIGDDMFVVPENNLQHDDENLYEIIYFHNDLTQEPSLPEVDWNKAKEVANNQNDWQEVIYISEEINDLVSQFQDRYKRG